MKSFTSGVVVTALGVALALAGTAQAQSSLAPNADVVVMEPGSNWGTTADIIVTYEASDFEILNGSYGGSDVSTGARYCGGAAPCVWLAGIRLPAGAIMRALELDACDSDPGAELQIQVLRSAKGGGAMMPISLPASTGATPGCAAFGPVGISPFETINNLNNNYVILVASGPTSATRFKAVRVTYRLQVSAAPATATFPNDVPTTHPFFRFVEALAAAGVTGGCGAGSYCPDAAVTRGQMAVFLATALGLHFPN